LIFYRYVDDIVMAAPRDKIDLIFNLSLVYCWRMITLLTLFLRKLRLD